MKDYSNMSDFEINKWIAVELAPDGYIGINKSPRSDSEVVVTTENGEGCTKNSYVDYCNNPSDAWPLIRENRISLRPDDMYEEAPHSGYWRADNEDGNHFHHENPLRAAMIVYLMMKDEEQ